MGTHRKCILADVFRHPFLYLCLRITLIVMRVKHKKRFDFMQVKMMLRGYFLALVWTTCYWKCKLVQFLQRWIRRLLTKLHISLFVDLVIPFLEFFCCCSTVTIRIHFPWETCKNIFMISKYWKQSVLVFLFVFVSVFLVTETNMRHPQAKEVKVAFGSHFIEVYFLFGWLKAGWQGRWEPAHGKAGGSTQQPARNLASFTLLLASIGTTYTQGRASFIHTEPR